MTTRLITASRVRPDDLLTEEGGPYVVQGKYERGGLVILVLAGLEYAYHPDETVEVQRGR